MQPRAVIAGPAASLTRVAQRSPPGPHPATLPRAVAQPATAPRARPPHAATVVQRAGGDDDDLDWIDHDPRQRARDADLFWREQEEEQRAWERDQKVAPQTSAPLPPLRRHRDRYALPPANVFKDDVASGCFRKGQERAKDSPGAIGNKHKSTFDGKYTTRILTSGVITTTFKGQTKEDAAKADGFYQNNPRWNGTFIIENVHAAPGEKGVGVSLSEIVYFQIKMCASDVKGWSWSRVLEVAAITNPATTAVTKLIVANMPPSKIENPRTLDQGFTFRPGDRFYYALLGTPLLTAAWGLLKDHGGDLGVRAIASIYFATRGRLMITYST